MNTYIINPHRRTGAWNKFAENIVSIFYFMG